MRQPSDALTAREREVLDLIRLGLTNEEIARRLGITLDGAKYHVSQILSKLGIATREEAAAASVAEAFEPRRRAWWARWPELVSQGFDQSSNDWLSCSAVRTLEVAVLHE